MAGNQLLGAFNAGLLALDAGKHPPTKMAPGKIEHLIAQGAANGNHCNHQRQAQQSVVCRNSSQQGDGFPFEQAANQQRPVAILGNVVGQIRHCCSFIAMK
ncbi:hypothetical protein D3C80_1699960 [compost metagenome]